MIIARTVKGKGISLLEDANGWHGKALGDEQWKQASGGLSDLGRAARGMIAAPEDRRPQRTAPQQVAAPRHERGKSVATRKAYGAALTRIAPKFPQLVSLDGEVSNSTMAEMFAAKEPARICEMFIAEQNRSSMHIPPCNWVRIRISIVRVPRSAPSPAGRRSRVSGSRYRSRLAFLLRLALRDLLSHSFGLPRMRGQQGSVRKVVMPAGSNTDLLFRRIQGKACRPLLDAGSDSIRGPIHLFGAERLQRSIAHKKAQSAGTGPWPLRHFLDSVLRNCRSVNRQENSHAVSPYQVALSVEPGSSNPTPIARLGSPPATSSAWRLLAVS